MRRIRPVIVVLLLAVGVGTAWAEDDQLVAFGRQISSPLPAEATSEANPVTEEKITLGRMLYYDARLSKNHDISCNSCHLLDNFGVDSQATSPGHRGQLGGRHQL